MEDNTIKTEENKIWEGSQKGTEQKNKDSNQPTSTETETVILEPDPSPPLSAAPSPALGASSSPPPGGNNAKRAVVANGQPPTVSSPPQRYMPREVPPRFRCQQDHKVLLKRGQPLLSCMLRGGGNNGEGTPPLSYGDNPESTTTGASDSGLGTSLSPSSTSAATASETSSYANSTVGEGSGSQPSSLDLDKVIMDGTKLEEWPSILEAGLVEKETDNYGAQNSSASWSDGFLQQQQQQPVLQVALGAEAVEGKDSVSGSPLSASSPSECPQSGGMWASSTQAEIGELVGATAQSSMSKGSPPENQESLLGIGSEVSGANSNPNCNSSAWPALVQDEIERAIAAAIETKAPLSQSSVSSMLDNAPLVTSSPDSASPENQELQAQELCSVDGARALCQQDNQGSEVKTGPKKGDADDDDMDSRIPGGVGNLSTSSSFSAMSSSSSWKSPLLPSSDPNTGASRADSWDTGMEVGGGGGGGGVWTAESPTNEKGAQVSAGTGWGVLGNEGSCMTRGVSQVAWDGEGGDIDTDTQEAARRPSSSAAGSVGDGDGSGSNSCGGSVVSAGGGGLSQDSQGSLTSEKAEDNQKGDGDGSAGVFTGQEESGGDSSMSGTQHHDHDQAQVPSGLQNPSPAVALRNMLGRGDLDPRVLCNTGWGQTQIRQNVAWDVEPVDRGARRDNSFNSAGAPAAYSGGASNTNEPGTASQRFGLAHSKEGWHGINTSLSSRGPPPPHDSHAVQKAAAGLEGGHGKLTRDMSRGDGGEGQGKGWGKGEPDWRESKRDDRESGEWGNFGGQGTSSSAKGSGWGDGQEEKGTGSWKELSMGTGDWRQNQSGGGGGGGGAGSWKDGKGSSTDEGSWSNWDDSRPKKSWGAGSGGGDVKAYQGWGAKQMATSQLPAMKGPNQQQQQSQAPQPQALRADPRALQEGRGRTGGAPHPSQSQSSGWTSGPIPQVTTSSEPSGWEEPSPQSISRNMEIDDGTAAWGDPSCYKSKSVNLWDKNSAQGQAQQQKPLQQPPQSLGRQAGPPMNRDSNLAPSMWGGVGRGPPEHSGDNGTTTWGKGSESSSGWGEPDDPGKGSGWGSRSPNPMKSGSKTMQEGWGEMDSSMGTTRHSSWEDEDEGSNMWNNTGSQGNSSSYSSVGWGHGNKRGNNKGGMKGGDSWMNPVNRQFSNMGMLDDDPSVLQDKRMEGDKRGMNEYNGEMRKGRGGGGVFRTPASKEVGGGEAGPYFDKMGGHGVFGGSGGMPPLRGMHPMNPTQGIRAQVPPQFLSPQVQSSILKQMPPPSGNLVGGIGGVPGGVFPPQLSPQHLAMLSGIHPHMQQILACQLLLQQQQQQQQQQQLLQNQRKFPQPMRQQPDPQQLARIMAVLQQQRQQQQGVGGVGTVGSKMSPSHLGGVPPKHSMPEHLQHPGLGSTLAELQAKAQGGYPGFGSPAGNLSGLELGGMVGAPGAVKDPVGPQSRFKWMMEGHSTAPSPPDAALHKNGPLTTPGKLIGGTPYAQYDLLGADGSGMTSQVLSDNWQRTTGMGQGPIMGTSSWPPEFQPGVPWKGIQSADPESDPYVTPGGVLSPHDPPNLSDTDHQLLRDNTGSNPALNTLLPSPGAWPYSASESPLSNAHSSAKYSEYKSSWPPEPIGHSKSWKTNRNSSQPSRPPPGLTNQKQSLASPWPTGGPRLARGWGGGSSQETRFESDSAWSDGSAPRGSCWLLLSNLTPQIDGSTLRTICMQHGPLLTFHLGLTQGSALIRYSTPQEAAKAQSALHMCVLGNTTILAEFVSEEDVARYFAHSQAAAGGAGGSGGAGGMGVSPGSAGPGTAGASSSSGGGSGGGGGGARKGDRDRARGSLSGGSSNGAEAGAVGSGAGSSASGWQNLDVAGSPLDGSAAQGSGLGIFAQWSTNGAGEGEGDGVGIGGGTGVVVEPGRSGLWGGVTPGYPSSSSSGGGSSLWGVPQMEDRHQISSPGALLPGDLLGGGTDTI
ncbi:trinucleotide repeat-containing gene 6B protein-like isoform X2 [Alosa sapidissima]|uniref:trinucleotide repeat-containing gene 6B protein-like isoform X2 n=1 Tax=Alosa sapidissima TaxID=34773 RepID=UPI001C0A2356|nr:trinucleotide repeat-containing gene 6B protein-like isoform X2 [Alosa sapidissima]